MTSPRLLVCLTLAAALPAAARADFVTLSVTVENLSPAGSVAVAPFRLGFNNGTFDSFDTGKSPTAPIISIAEGGSGKDWFPAFAKADPTATLGTVGGALVPGASATGTFTVDGSVNPYFTFAAMVVPSNDYFIGNDSPTRFRLFDTAGLFTPRVITQSGRDIWNAGSELFNPLNAAFLKIGNNDLRDPENGVVGFDFAELSKFDGLETAAGYTFKSQLTAADPFYRITISAAPVANPVPAPPAVVLLAAGAAGLAAVRRARRR